MGIVDAYHGFQDEVGNKSSRPGKREKDKERRVYLRAKHSVIELRARHSLLDQRARNSEIFNGHVK